MPKRLKHLKGRVKETIRGFFGKSPAQSTHAGSDTALPSANASRSESPTPKTIIPTPFAQPVPAPAVVQSPKDNTGQSPPVCASVPPASSPTPQIIISDSPPYAPPASAPPNVQSPDASAARSGRMAFQTFLASGVFGPLQPLINDIAGLFEAYKDTLAADSEYGALQDELKSLLETLNRSFSGDNPIVTEIIGTLRGSINEELDKISGRETEGLGRRFMQANKDLDKVVGCYRRIRGLVDSATLGILGGHGKMLTEQEKVLGEYGKRLDEQAKLAQEPAKLAKDKAIEDQLKELKPSLSACYKSDRAANLRRECTPNTRKDVLSHLDRWRRDSIQGNIFWMNGMAGTGKTTIANTLCATLKSEQKLGASFFCTRTLPECRSAKLILPTIAYQLARFSSPFRDALFQALKFDPDLLTKDLPTQLEGLILAPLRNATEPLPSDVVIVIDALDECEDRTAVEEILGVFMAQASTLPIKVFVSSRPEEEIRRQIGDTTSQVVLHELDEKAVQDDIAIYLREELKGTSVSDDQLAELVERAGVLFIYAATVARFINTKRSSTGQQERLTIVLGTSSTSPSRKYEVIDALYDVVLKSAFNKPELEDFERDRMRELLHSVVCTQEPLTADALAGLLKMADSDLVLDALEPLWSVIRVSGTGGNSLVTTLHASFPDYMFDEKRSKEHCCNAKSHHGQLAELCLARIENNKRQFNICMLESSHIPDEQVPDLEDRINNAIPLDLLYACQYWATHLELGEWSTDRVELLEYFLSKRLLLWMEVLNLKKRMNSGAVSLEKARKWCTNGGDPETVGELIHDAWRFVTTFASNRPMSLSTPHIYVSMLPFWPSSKLITEFYVKRARGLAEVSGSGMTRRQLALLGEFAVGSEVLSVAFSPDSLRIICGCRNGAISMWDAQSGNMVLGPLKKHTGPVNSVAFSPNGQRIASGSDDETIRLWDARSGEMVLKPLEGHSYAVNSVAFSRDSARIVSGSNNICVWDAESGDMVLGPLEGHTESVNSVAFSPDGMRIVSGSNDETILVWDSHSGQVALGPLEGHTDRVYSVAFSPNGDQIVSGSHDRTITVWDAQSGKLILGPLDGKSPYISGYVFSVAFSPDGTHIVSGTSDRTVRLFDARSGEVVLGQLEGHTAATNSVAVSPDGTRIVSGSYDKTIRVWDAKSRGAPPKFTRHDHSVISVAFSSDGTRVITGACDFAVRLWDAQTGEAVLQRGEYTFGQSLLAFSPDGMQVAYATPEKIKVAPLSGPEEIGADATEFFPMSLDGTTGVTSVTFSPDGMHIISGCWDNTILMWDAENGRVVLGPLEGHTGLVRSVAFSPNGMFIVSGSDDYTVRMWDAQNGNVLLSPLEGHDGGVNSVALSPDGKCIASGADDRTIRTWDVQSGKMALRPLEGHDDDVLSVAFSPNGMYIVSGSADKTIRVWAAQTGDLVLGPLSGHIRPITSVSFSPDSTQIVSGSHDLIGRVWRLPTQCLTAESEPSPPATSSPSSPVINFPVPQPSLPLQVSRNPSFQWSPNEDGWVVDEHHHLWLWIPPDLRTSIIMPHNYNTLLLGTKGPVQINLDGAAIGDSWAGLYSTSTA